MGQTFTLAQLAEAVGGTAVGDSNIKIFGVAPTHLADGRTITFFDNSGKKNLLDGCAAAAAVVPIGFSDAAMALVQVENVEAAFCRIAEMFLPPRTHQISGVSSAASIDSSAKLGENVSVGAGAYIGAEVEMGDGCVIYPNAVILDGTTVGRGTTIFPNVCVYENCRIGNNCIIHANSSIGAYGFGYDSSESGHKLSAQLGNVVLEDDVEVGACSTIDRATHGSTLIGAGTKIDNLVMIAHNCRLGRFNLICAHSGIAGSTTTGDFVVMAGRVGVKDHVHIGTGAILGAMAGIMEDIPPKSQYVGIPATELREQFKKQVALAKLPEMRREFILLQKEVKKLAEKIAELEK